MRRFWLLSLLASGCNQSTEPPTIAAVGDAEQPTLQMHASGTPVQHLTRMLDAATFDLSIGHAPDADQPRPWALTDWKSKQFGPHRIWNHKLPASVSQRRVTAKPDGLTFEVNGVAFEYKAGLFPGDALEETDVIEGRWELRGGRIVAVGPGSFNEATTVLFNAEFQHDLKRRDFGIAGMTAAAFADLTIEKGLETRRSVYLPPPASARFPIDVPDNGVLLFGIGVEHLDSSEKTGQARFEVVVDETTLFSELAAGDEPWADHRVDLSAYAGQRIQLELRTSTTGPEEPRAFAAFSAPRVVASTAKTEPNRIVVIGLDTLRKDHLGTHGYDRPVSPAMDAIAAQSVVFEEAWTPAPRTRPSFRSATTGRWPLRAVNAPNLGELFRANGWSTAGFVANVQLAPRLGFADGFDLWSYDNMADGDEQVDRTLAWLTSHQDENAFVFLHMMDPHIFYEAPKPFLNRFSEPFDNEGMSSRYNRWDIGKRMKAERLSDQQKKWIEGRYDGEIAFMDKELARLINGIDALPGNTMVVFHNDHGEEFWEHGDFEHNHSLYNELVAAVLWVRPPGGWSGGPHRINAPVSLVDIAPTLASVGGLRPDTVPDFDGVDLSPFLSADKQAMVQGLASSLEARPLPIGHMMFNPEQWGVIHHDWKYIVHTATGDEELYDLTNDPNEERNRSADTPTEDMQGALSQATGWPVLSGWRLKFSKLPHPTTIKLGRPVGRAFVLDPEVARSRRANLEWGEIPPISPQDVATVTVSEDRKEVTISPGISPSGIVFIEGLTAQDTARATCKLGGSRVRPKATSSLCSRRTQLTVGPLLLQQEDESDSLRSAPEAQTVEALRSLGYLD